MQSSAACVECVRFVARPSIQRIADSLPLIIPHSKSSQGPMMSEPSSLAVRRPAAKALRQLERGALVAEGGQARKEQENSAASKG